MTAVLTGKRHLHFDTLTSRPKYASLPVTAVMFATSGFQLHFGS